MSSSTRAVKRLARQVQQDIDRHLDTVIATGEADLIHDLAEHVPADTICRAAGIDDMDLARRIRVAAQAGLDAGGKDPAAFAQAIGAFGELVMPLVEQRRAVFNDPEEFRLDRATNKHLVFGYGVHTCVGAPLARLELTLAMQTMPTRMPDAELVGEPPEKFFGGAGATYLPSLPVRFTPGARRRRPGRPPMTLHTDVRPVDPPWSSCPRGSSPPGRPWCPGSSSPTPWSP